VAATFLAKSFRDASVAAPAEKPSVSPQPPTAIQTLVPGSNKARTDARSMKGAYWPPGSVVKSDDCANAVMTCVMPAVTVLLGRTVVWYLSQR